MAQAELDNLRPHLRDKHLPCDKGQTRDGHFLRKEGQAPSRTYSGPSFALTNPSLPSQHGDMERWGGKPVEVVLLKSQPGEQQKSGSSAAPW